MKLSYHSINIKNSLDVACQISYLILSYYFLGNMRTGHGTNVLTLNCTSEIENYGNSIFFFFNYSRILPHRFTRTSLALLLFGNYYGLLNAYGKGYSWYLEDSLLSIAKVKAFRYL